MCLFRVWEKGCIPWCNRRQKEILCHVNCSILNRPSLFVGRRSYHGLSLFLIFTCCYMIAIIFWLFMFEKWTLLLSKDILMHLFSGAWVVNQHRLWINFTDVSFTALRIYAPYFFFFFFKMHLQHLKYWKAF